MDRLIDNMTTALAAVFYYIGAAVNAIVKNRYLMIISVIGLITLLMRPTSFKLGKLFQYQTSRN